MFVVGSIRWHGLRHGAVPLCETYAIGGEFLTTRGEHDDAQYAA